MNDIYTTFNGLRMVISLQLVNPLVIAGVRSFSCVDIVFIRVFYFRTVKLLYLKQFELYFLDFYSAAKPC